MSPIERRTHRAAATRDNASLRRVLDDLEARLVEVEGQADTNRGGGKSERGKLRAADKRIEERLAALEGSS